MVRFATVVAAASLLLNLGQVVLASPPDALEVTCDVDRTAFRSLSTAASNATFRLWNAVSGGTQCGSDHVVPMDQILALRPKGDKFDGQSPRKFLELRARLGTDGASGTPVTLCAGGETWLEIEVASTTLTCDFSADPNSKQSVAPNAPPRRRLGAVAFAKESGHSDTCDTCTTTTTPAAGSAKAWVNFNGTTGAIRRQNNVSSVAHPSLGNFVINFATPMTDADYAAQITTTWNGAGNQAVYAMIVSQTASSLTIYINNGTSAYGAYDPAIVSVVIVD